MESHAEQRPLLRPSSYNAANAEQGSPQVGHSGQRHPLATVLCVRVIFALARSSAVQTAPRAEIYEAIIGRNHARQGTRNSAKAALQLSSIGFLFKIACWIFLCKNP